MNGVSGIPLHPWLTAWAVYSTALATATPPPQLNIRATDDAAAVLAWPASAGDFVLEESRQPAASGLWLPVAIEPTLDGDDYAVHLPRAGHTRFFRLRYHPAALRSTAPAISFALVVPAGAGVGAGQPFAVELRASFNSLLAAASVRVSVSGPAEARLTGRSADPGQANGLMFISDTLQEPFENGLPTELTGEGSLEVLLGTGTWPFDGLPPGEEVVLERLEITPLTVGELTLSLMGAEAVTSRWANDGLPFETVSLDPWRSTLTVSARAVVALSGAGTPGTVSGMTRSVGSGSRSNAGLSRLTAQAAPEIRPNADGQGGVDLADLVYVRARLGLDPVLTENAGADVNQDQAIDLLDLVAVRNRLSPPPGFGDFPVPRLNEVAPNPGNGEAPWVEFTYPRWVEPYSYLLELRNAAQEVLLGSWPEPISLWVPYIVIVFDGEGPIEYLGEEETPTAARVHLPRPETVFDPTEDQCLLYLDGALVDSVRWGDQPERNGALNTGIFPIPPGGSIGRDGLEEERWVRFSQGTPGAGNGLPVPLALCPVSGGAVWAGESTSFAWVDPRNGPVRYGLEVCRTNDLQTPVLDTTCYQPGHVQSPGLNAGQYRWRVRPIAGELQGPWSGWQDLEVIDPPAFPGPGAVGLSGRRAQGGVPVAMRTIAYFTGQSAKRAPMKDTRMLCLECLLDQGPHAWDVPHGTTQWGVITYHGGTTFLCPHELGHAATAIAQWLNEYYGERLTQDEINYALRDGSHSPEGDLCHGQLTDLRDAINDALGTVGTHYQLLNLLTDPDWNKYRTDIDAGKPVATHLMLKAGGGTGPVLLVGYVESDLYGAPVRHVLFLSPLLAGATQILNVQALVDGGFACVRPMEPPGKYRAEASDPYVFQDSDGDGMCDLDEEDRFPTDRLKPDADGDGITDKIEVWSYKFGRGRVARTADSDGDGLRAEEDDDSDGDGCLDGAEDRNHDGTLYAPGWLGLGQVLKIKAEGETDPFWVDEFKLTLTAERMPLRFKESTRLNVTLTDDLEEPVPDAQVRLRLSPILGSFDGSGGTPVTTVFVLTDQDGKASAEFFAGETQGTVTLEAVYQRNPKDRENKAELKLQILPQDWIFAVQEKAVLTGPDLVNDRGVTDGVWEVSRSRDVGFQKVSGHFEHPFLDKPEAFIQSIAVGQAYAAVAVLRIDGTNVSNLTWTRASTNDLPTRWEIEIASPIWTTEDYKMKLPRYLLVTARGGGERRTPLLWWKDCGTVAQNRRVKMLLSEPTFPYAKYGRLLAIDWIRHSYEFFFGDGSVDDPGGDPVCWNVPHPDPNGHTAVSYIPVKGVPGHAIGERQQAGWPFDAGVYPWDKEGGIYSYIFNAYCKDTIAWTPDAPWTVDGLGDEAAYNRYDIDEDVLATGPPEPPPFLDDIRFKRDYLGTEWQELQQRKLDPPQYEIRMLTEE
ncbi:MAG: hypothetical protein H7A46_04705 [Verrucomicrobiales bacterium]|nr:hypothetical protein [Verrucomicrobiales bacterium]